jgi:hypothetical protein
MTVASCEVGREGGRCSSDLVGKHFQENQLICYKSKPTSWDRVKSTDRARNPVSTRLPQLHFLGFPPHTPMPSPLGLMVLTEEVTAASTNTSSADVCVETDVDELLLLLDAFSSEAVEQGAGKEDILEPIFKSQN